MKNWTKPAVIESQIGMEVTSYSGSEEVTL
jgi:coenzyme PQQ precursor peptide PqqA